jgi:thiosulfate dehydrogenase
VAAACGYVVLRTGLVPANADAKPGWFETWAAGTSLDATLARDAPNGPNPVALTDANLIAGINLYGEHCAICHGTAKGDASASPVAKGEYPSPPQLATDGVEDDPEGHSFWVISHGIRWSGMPAWKGTLTDEQIWTCSWHGQAAPRPATGLAERPQLSQNCRPLDWLGADLAFIVGEKQPRPRYKRNFVLRRGGDFRVTAGRSDASLVAAPSAS